MEEQNNRITQTQSDLKNNQFNFDAIIQLNESIKEVNYLSFRIRLKALNSLISISRLDKKEAIGFNAVSFELIDFSKKIEEQAILLRKLIYDIILHFTFQKKAEKKISLLKNTQAKLSQETQKLNSLILSKIDSYNLEEKQIREMLEMIIQQLKDTLKISKKGSFISICTKIETAYLKNIEGMYSQLAEEVSTSLKNLDEILLKIYKSLNSLYVFV